MKKRLIFIATLICILIYYTIPTFAYIYDGDGQEQPNYIKYAKLRLAIERIREEYAIADNTKVFVIKASYTQNQTARPAWRIVFYNSLQMRAYMNRISSTQTNLYLTYYDDTNDDGIANERVYPYNNESHMRFAYFEDTDEYVRNTSDNAFNFTSLPCYVPTPSNYDNVGHYLNIGYTLHIFSYSDYYLYINGESVNNYPSHANNDNWVLFRSNWFGIGAQIPGQNMPSWTDYIGSSLGDPFVYDTPTNNPYANLTLWQKIELLFENYENITDLPTLIKGLFKLVLELLYDIGQSIINIPSNLMHTLYTLFVPSQQNIAEWNDYINSITTNITSKVEPVKQWLISENSAGYPTPLYSFKLVGTSLQTDAEHILIDWYGIASYVIPYQYVIHIFITILLCIMSINFIFETFDVKSRLAWDSIREVSTY